MTVIPLRPNVTGPGPAATDAPDPGRVVYTVGEVAELLGVGPGTIYAMLRAGELPARRARDRWIISKRRLHAWLDDADDTTPAGAR
jgi:excisionase family DNA binding protein